MSREPRSTRCGVPMRFDLLRCFPGWLWLGECRQQSGWRTIFPGEDGILRGWRAELARERFDVVPQEREAARGDARAIRQLYARSFTPF